MKDPDRYFRGRNAWITGLAFWSVVGLLSFLYHYLDVFVRGATEPFYEKLIEEMTGAYGVGLLFPFLARFVRQVRTRHLRWPLTIAIYIGALPLFSILHTTWNWVSRELVISLLDLGNYDYGIMSLRYAMEFPNDVLGYVILVTFISLFDHYRAAKDHETRLAHLSAELNASRLQALESQLQPHFLFNALNTISSVMYRDVAAADDMITRLGDLLRRSLRTPEDHEVTLAEEIETLGLYLDIMRNRFADALDATVHVQEGIGEARVPHLVLQPLVENALRHGHPGVGQTARVRVEVLRENGRLRMTVTDNGPGVPDPGSVPDNNGVGLANTKGRLRHLHGDDYRFELRNRDQGGLAVTIEIPFHA